MSVVRSRLTKFATLSCFHAWLGVKKELVRCRNNTHSWPVALANVAGFSPYTNWKASEYHSVVTT